MPVIIFGLSNIVLTAKISSFFAMPSSASAAFHAYLVLAGFSALVYGLCDWLSPAFIIEGLVMIAMSLSSYMKNVVDGSPLMLSDLTLMENLSELLSFSEGKVKIPLISIISMAVFVLLMVLLVLSDIKSTPVRGKLKLSLISAGLCLFLVLFVSSIGADWSKEYSEDYTTSALKEHELGTAQGLFAAWQDDRFQTISKSVKDAVEEQLKKDSIDYTKVPKEDSSVLSEGDTGYPTIIFILAESFYDVTELPNISFTEDPCSNFHRLSETCASGQFLSHTYGGGTGWVEYETLTGVSNTMIRSSQNITDLPDEIYKRMPSIPKILDMNGYTKTFIHSYTDSLYHRREFYTDLNFETIMFSDDFPEDAEMKGGYISDNALADVIIEQYEKNKGTRQFFQVTTMQNHQPYVAGKYQTSSGILVAPTLSEEAYGILDCAVQGIRDEDAMLGKLTEYFSSQDEPVMIVFYGDHKPNLYTADNVKITSQLGYTKTDENITWDSEDFEKMISTNYLFWTNYECNISAGKKSAVQIGMDAVKAAGLELSEYAKWYMLYVEPVCTLYHERIYVDGQGRVYDSVPEEYQSTLENYRYVVQTAVYGKDSQQLF